MAMSEGERISRLLQPGGRYLSNQQTKDSSLQTQIVQARASGVVGIRNSNFSVRGSRVYDSGNGTLGYVPETPCCVTTYYSNRDNFSGYTGLYQAAEKCAVCANPDYANITGYAIDLSGGTIRGGYVAPLPNLANTAKTTIAEQCASCKKFYFPGQPRCCPPVYTTNYIDTFDDKYGINNSGR